MAKWGLIIMSAILGISLGSILQDQVCAVSKPNLGSGTFVMKATCVILSNPIYLIMLIVAIFGLIGYLIWDYNN